MSFPLPERRRWCQSYPARPDSVPVARRELAQFAADAGAAADRLEDVRLAASEAITSIVLHAYDGAAGQVRVEADVATGELRVQIAGDDRALGPRFEDPRLGMGLALIIEAADELSVVNRAGGGTELRMRFGLGD